MKKNEVFKGVSIDGLDTHDLFSLRIVKILREEVIAGEAVTVAIVEVFEAKDLDEEKMELRKVEIKPFEIVVRIVEDIPDPDDNIDWGINFELLNHVKEK